MKTVTAYQTKAGNVHTKIDDAIAEELFETFCDTDGGWPALSRENCAAIVKHRKKVVELLSQFNDTSW